MKKIFFLTMLLSMIVLISVAQKKNKSQAPAVIDWTSYDFTKHFTLKNGGGKKIFGDNKRLFISNFQINQTIVANGKQTGSSNLAKMTVGMTPIDVNAYQELVNKLYARLTEQLKAEGYELVSDEEVANSEFAKEQHNGKTVFCQYAKDVAYDKDQNGNQILYLWPTNKFIVSNTKTVLGTWPSKFGKALDANIISVVLIVNPVSFDGSRRSGYKGGPSIEADAVLTIFPYCYATNEKAGFAVWGTHAGGNSNWVGPKGMTKTDNSTNVFGSVKGTYVIDVNQDAYLSEVEKLGGGLSEGFVKALMAEVK